MINVILVDDEQPALNVLDKLIARHTKLNVLRMIYNPYEVMEAVRQLKPDAVFLDIDLPDLSGMELARQLGVMDDPPAVVFVTAYSQYALQAFRVNAIDYLLKPINPQDIVALADKLERRFRSAARPKPLQPEIEPIACTVVCFGTLKVIGVRQSEPLRFPTAKVAELFAYLLVNRHKMSSKWALCEQLWPNWEPEKAEQNLHTSIFRLRKKLGEHGVRFALDSQRGSYRLILNESCDYTMFDDTLPHLPDWSAENMHTSEKDGSFADPDRLEPLLRLYKGPLFDGMDFEWGFAESERLRRKYVQWTVFAGRQLLVRRQFARGCELLRLLLQISPYEEEGHRLLLETLLAAGDRAAFAEHYELLKQLYMRDLGLKPNEELEKMYLSIKP